MELTRLQQTILYILQLAKESSIDNLTRYQLMKLIYLIEVESRRYLGTSFIKDVRFHREPRGPISYDVYNATNEMDGIFIDIDISPIKGYGKNRASHSLKKDISLPINFTKEEKLFLSSVLGDFIKLDQKKLGEIVYGTEPMVQILQQEKQAGSSLKGIPISLDNIPLDGELLELLEEEDHE